MISLVAFEISGLFPKARLPLTIIVLHSWITLVISSTVFGPISTQVNVDGIP